MLENKQSSFPSVLREYSADFDRIHPTQKVELHKSATGVGFGIAGGKDGHGVYVSSIVPGGPADTSGEVRVGDKLLWINDHDVGSASVSQVDKLLKHKGDKYVTIICQNRIEDFYELEALHPEEGETDTIDELMAGGHGRQSSRSQVPHSQESPRAGKKRAVSTKSRAESRSVSTSMSSRKDTKSRKAEDERYVALCEKWEQAKQEVRQEDHETLQEKVALQQELIRRQDAMAEQRRLHLSMLENQRREEEKAKKQAKEAELKKICKESLEADRKTQREEKAKLRKKHEQATSTPSPTKSPTSPTTPRGRRSTPFKMTLPAMSATPDLIDPEDNDPSPEPSFVVSKDIPWHEQQLYNMYGKEADYFLHPKIEAKAQVKKANPKLRRQGVDELFANYWREYEEGRAGAEILWKTLRQDSQQRLMQEDASIPVRLKDAYGAFARQSLKKTNVPVRRMFCVENDLPELDRLLDNQRVQKVHRMRHKTDLMYRSSVSNQDRTEVLNFNNPLPDFNSRAESINQYLPSWQDDSSEESFPDYMRWVPPKGMTARENTITEEQEEGEETTQAEYKKPNRMAQSMDEDLMLILSRRRQPQTKQKYVFLSEKDTLVKGEFSEKYKDEREYKDIPRPYNAGLAKSYSALGGMISASPDKSTSTMRYSAPLAGRYDALQRYTSGWQPLSMTALVEYKKQMSTIGEGDFNLGRTKMWSNIPVI